MVILPFGTESLCQENVSYCFGLLTSACKCHARRDAAAETRDAMRCDARPRQM